MFGTSTESPENQEEFTQIGSWEEAFAALDAEAQGNTQAAPTSGTVAADDNSGDNGNNLSDVPDTNADNQGGNNGSHEANIGFTPEDNVGGSDSFGGGDNSQDGTLGGNTEEFIEVNREAEHQRINDEAMATVIKAYIDGGARHTNGKIGADIYQPDICKRDKDGVPHFFNPKTGREFSSRQQAEDWCHAYNQELKTEIDKTYNQYSEQLWKEREPEIAVLEFAPIYESLDPIRATMFDSLIENYEIVKDGEIVGYSCDLNKALEAVNRQVRMIQEQYRTSQPQVPQPHQDQPSGPALDIKSSSQANNDKNKKPEFKSVAEAMEWQQDQLLAKQKGK